MWPPEVGAWSREKNGRFIYYLDYYYKRDKRDIGDKRDNLKNFFSTPAAQPLGHLVSRFYPTSGFAGHLPPGSAS